jgi:ABC-2 type transport system ATP-binding protein
MKNDSLLQVRSLIKIFTTPQRWFTKTPKKAPFVAVNNISFDLHEGEILGFLGPNGAGKTTTIQLLLSVMSPSSGSIFYFGKELYKHRSEVLEKITFASTYVKLPGKLTVYENLAVAGQLYGLARNELDTKIREFMKFFDMWHLRDRLCSTLSAGQATRAMLVKAFLTNPKIVLLDEPTAALDPNIAYEIRSFILHQKKERGVAILLTSHNMDEVAEVCDRVLVLKNGTIIADNTPKKLAASVAGAHVHFVITDGMKRTQEYLQQQAIVHYAKDRRIEITIDEEKIPQLLTDLMRLGVVYSHIAIERPTLQDYFWHIAE